MSESVAPAVFDEPTLLAAPVRRAAYSDRTAWLMSAMSELAYFKFEGGEDFVSLASDLVSMGDAKEIEERLRKFLLEMDTTAADGRKALEACLEQAGFTLINTYNFAGTQAFLTSKPKDQDFDGMRVLAFRGTEKSFTDFKTDLTAELVAATDAPDAERIHRGFLKAFEAVKKSIEKDLGQDAALPLYVTGHSLGGALAIVATRFIAGDSLGACYTFGSPRVGNLDLGLAFKTPIYRVVNSADIVPRTPPGYVLALVIGLLNLFHAPDWLIHFIERFRGYTHFGDMRYLNHVEAGRDGRFQGLKLIPNPSLLMRATWVVSRWVATFGRAAIGDHSISLYRRKLRAYALFRQS